MRLSDMSRCHAALCFILPWFGQCVSAAEPRVRVLVSFSILEDFARRRARSHDLRLRERLGAIPAEKRLVITIHDAFAYSGGLTVSRSWPPKGSTPQASLRPRPSQGWSARFATRASRRRPRPAALFRRALGTGRARADLYSDDRVQHRHVAGGHAQEPTRGATQTRSKSAATRTLGTSWAASDRISSAL